MLSSARVIIIKFTHAGNSPKLSFVTRNHIGDAYLESLFMIKQPFVRLVSYPGIGSVPTKTRRAWPQPQCKGPPFPDHVFIGRWNSIKSLSDLALPVSPRVTLRSLVDSIYARDPQLTPYRFKAPPFPQRLAQISRPDSHPPMRVLFSSQSVYSSILGLEKCPLQAYCANVTAIGQLYRAA